MVFPNHGSVGFIGFGCSFVPMQLQELGCMVGPNADYKPIERSSNDSPVFEIIQKLFVNLCGVLQYIVSVGCLQIIILTRSVYPRHSTSLQSQIVLSALATSLSSTPYSEKINKIIYPNEVIRGSTPRPTCQFIKRSPLWGGWQFYSMHRCLNNKLLYKDERSP